jgi:thiol-disulfide isomerase/thioredoxin
LTNGWQVDQAILSEEDRVVIIRFGHDWDPTCMKMDETLYGVAERVKNFAVIYLVDITEVPDFNKVQYHAQFNSRLHYGLPHFLNNISFTDVRIVRSLHRHVLLSKQTYYD